MVSVISEIFITKNVDKFVNKLRNGLYHNVFGGESYQQKLQTVDSKFTLTQYLVFSS